MRTRVYRLANIVRSVLKESLYVIRNQEATVYGRRNVNDFSKIKYTKD